jgi:hypothetical protein
MAFGGIPERGIYDNMKTAVDNVGHGKQRQVNKRFHAMVGHHLYEPEFCNPATGLEKGQAWPLESSLHIKIWIRPQKIYFWMQRPGSAYVQREQVAYLTACNGHPSGAVQI